MTSDSISPVAIRRKHLLLVIGMAFVWVFLSGIGGFSNQDWDHHFRNALFRDLIIEPWPVYYSFPAGYHIEALANHHSALNYYFTFWLPAAWIGKMFGRELADFFLLGWSYTGTLLALYYFNRLAGFRYLGFVSLIFILWSGLDILGKLIVQKHLVQFEEPIELYYHYFFTAFTSDLYNPFNQAIPTWIITAWVLNNTRKLNILPITFLVAYAPFPFVGLVLFYYGQYIINKFESGSTIRSFLRNLLTDLIKPDALAAFGIVIAYGLFYQAHTSDVRSGLFWSLFLQEDLIRNLKTTVSYFITFFLEAGVYLALIRLLSIKVYQTYKLYFWLCFGLLLIIPVWVVGEYNDFASRGSMPILVVLCLLTLKAIIDRFESRRKKYVLFIPAIILLLSWVTPAISLIKSVPLNGNAKLKDAIGTFADPKISKYTDTEDVLSSVANFYSHEPEQHLFYKYIAK